MLVISVVSILVGIAIVVWGVVVWFGHITVIHALASIIVFIGVSVALGGCTAGGLAVPSEARLAGGTARLVRRLRRRPQARLGRSSPQ